MILAASWEALAQPLPPGLEARVSALTQGVVLPAPWSVAEASIEPTCVRIKLDGPSRASVVLRRTSAEDPSGRALGHTRSFSLWLVPPDGPLEAATALRSVIEARDDGTFFGAIRSPQGADAPANALDRGPPDTYRRLLAWLGAIVLAGIVLRATGRRTWLAALLVFSTALAIRWSLPEKAPLHANGHGIAELRGLAGFPGFDAFEPETDRYGGAHRELVRGLLSPVFGHGTEALWLQGLFGALGVLAVFALALVLLESLSAATGAGLVAAALPAHAWLSVTESPMPLAGALWLFGAASLVSALRARGGRVHLLAWLASACLSLSGELAVTTLALPISAFALCLGLPFEAWRARWKALVGPFVALVASMVLHVSALAPIFAETRSRRSGEFAGSLDRLLHGGLLLSSLELTGVLVLAALAGLWIAGRRSLRITSALIVSTLIALIPGLIVNVALTDRLRYQTVPLMPLAVLAGFAFVSLDRVRAGAIALASIGSLLVLRSVPLEVQAYRLIRTAPLPEYAEVHVPQRRLGAGGSVIAEFPEYLLRIGTVVPRPATGPGERCYTWIGPACWSFTRAEVEASEPERSPRFDGQPIRRECGEFVSGLDPLDSRSISIAATVPWRDDEFHRIVAERPRLGLFPCRAGDIPRPGK